MRSNVVTITPNCQSTTNQPTYLLTYLLTSVQCYSRVYVDVQLLNSMLADEKLGIDGLGALFPVSEVRLQKSTHSLTCTHTCLSTISSCIWIS